MQTATGASDAALAAALGTAPPRTPTDVRTIVGRGGVFYTRPAALVWGIVILVAASVAATTPGAQPATFFEAGLYGSIMFGLPVQIFASSTGTSFVRALARGSPSAPKSPGSHSSVGRDARSRT